MKIALYSPYVPKHMGGGEKYLFDVAAVLLKQGHKVFLAVSAEAAPRAIDKQNLKDRYQAFTQQDLSQLEVITSPLTKTGAFLEKLLWTAKFDVIYYQTDGSLFFSLARKNILHIQIPFTTPKSSLLERLKLKNWGVKNTNSEFTRQIIESSWKTKVQFVHYPMIQPLVKLSETEQVLNQKQPLILNVGRFFRQLHCKHQEILVQSFRNLRAQFPQEMKNWKLVCLGSVEDESYAAEVRALAQGLPVEFVHESSRATLETFYRAASIYWHATGFGENPRKNPEKMEHFGISTVEAMSAGAAPVVIGQGGQVEILRDLPAWNWQTQAELESKTLTLIRNPQQRRTVQQQAMRSAYYYDEARFAETLRRMLA